MHRRNRRELGSAHMARGRPRRGRGRRGRGGSPGVRAARLQRAPPFTMIEPMGFLKRLRGDSGEESRTTNALVLHASGVVSVVGESHRQDALARVAREATGPEPYLADLKGRARAVAREEGRLWFLAALLREPDNPYDANAIAVHATGVGLIGYLDRETALDYASVFDELARQGCSVGACPAVLTGGGPSKSWGVVLCLSSPDAVISDLRSPPRD